jgi:hypothetical protein
MSLEQTMKLDRAGAGALITILGIVLDNVQEAEAEGYRSRWNVEHVLDLDTRFHHVWPELTESRMGFGPGDADDSADGGVREMQLHIEDAELLLAGMAFTEMASTDLPFFEMVQWTSEFVASELRQLWTDDIWRSRAGLSGDRRW